MSNLQDILYTIGSAFLGPIIFGSIGYLVGAFAEKWKDFKKQCWHSVKITAAKHQKIQDILTEIRLKYDGTRAYLSMFHNGDKYINGSEILKYSRTNESVVEGVSLNSSYYQDINISLVPEEMKLIVDPNICYVKVKDLQDGKFKRMLVSRNIGAIVRVAVRQNNDIIGFIGIDFEEETPEQTDINQLCIFYAGIIEQILSSK